MGMTIDYGEPPGIYWKDKSGDRLREWLGVDEDTFYKAGKNR